MKPQPTPPKKNPVPLPPEVRKKIMRDRSRNRYRTVNDAQPPQTVDMRKLASSFEKLTDASTSYKVTGITIESLADALGYDLMGVYRWQSKEKFPKPTRKAVEHKGAGYFTPKEARAICAAMQKHQADHFYLYDRDTVTIGRLFAAMQ